MSHDIIKRFNVFVPDYIISVEFTSMLVVVGKPAHVHSDKRSHRQCTHPVCMTK